MKGVGVALAVEALNAALAALIGVGTTQASPCEPSRFLQVRLRTDMMAFFSKQVRRCGVPF